MSHLYAPCAMAGFSATLALYFTIYAASHRDIFMAFLAAVLGGLAGLNIAGAISP